MSKDEFDDFNFDEDFGEDLANTVAVKEKPVQEIKQETVKSTPVKTVPENKTEEVVGVKSVGFGTKVSSSPIVRFKGQKDFKSRIAIISDQVQAVKVHYVDGIGSFVCFEGKCCEFEGFPRVKYLVPVVQYDTNKNGKPISESIELKVLVIGQDAYSALADVINMSGRGVTDLDVVVSCSDEQYQKLTFAADTSSGCLWKTYPTAKALYKFYKDHVGDLYLAVARKITPESYLMKKGFVTGGSSAPAVAQVSNLEDLLE